MVSGEYAVLSGARALVLAVGARAFARLTPEGDRSEGRRHGSPVPHPPGPEVMLAKEHAERMLGVPPMDLSIDTDALREGDRKLGLGSSAAGAVAAAAAVFASAGIDPASARDRVFAAALAGHHAVAPNGSGADVASAAHGGLIRFRRDEGGAEIEPRALPTSIAISLVWTGSPVRTSDLVARVKELAAKDPSAHARAIGAIVEAAAALDLGFAKDDAEAIFEATRSHHDAMRRLGEAADAPIVTPALAALDRIARSSGGAAKPSGAGGGDVALLFLPREHDGAGLGDALSAAGLTPLSLSLGVEGARAEETAGAGRVSSSSEG
jgi:phosphomevalonate kinase